MTFLNATLIFGIAAVSVPIVLHLIARREPRKVVFPSVRFLTKRFESNRSRLRVRRWWLLALRIAAIAALALALARPAIDRSLSLTWLTIGMVAAAGIALLIMATVALTKGQSRSMIYSLSGSALVALLVAILWGGYTFASGPELSIDNESPMAIAIVLDNSPTSAWRTVDDDRINRMQDLATWMVTRLPPTSRIAIIDRSAQPATFSLDVASAVAKIEQLQALQVTQPIASRIDAAARLVRTSDLTSRQVLLVTDLTASTWNLAAEDSGLASLISLQPAVTLTVFDLGNFEKANRSLSIPELADATPAPGAPVSISTQLDLFVGDETESLSVAAELQIYDDDPTLPVIRDGEIKLPSLQSVDRTSVRVTAGGSSNLLLTVPPLKVGTHHGLLRLVGDDALPLDDVRYFTLRVLPPAPVLLVGDDEDEARVISLAMSSEFAVERIPFADLPVVRMADYPAIMMIDPPGEVLADESLTEFVGDGGALLVCLGPACDDDALALPNGGQAMSHVPPRIRRWRATKPGTFFQVMTPSHPLLSPLAEIAGGVPWSGFRVQQYWQLKVSENDAVLIRFAGTDHAALTERVIDAANGRQGRLLTLATPLPALAEKTRRWNELFSASEPWPAFLLVRQFAEYLNDRGVGESMSLVGQPQLIRLDPASDGAEDDAVDPRRLQLFPPNGAAPVPLNVAPGNSQIVFNDVSRSGTYWLRGAGGVSGFSANLPDDATKLDRMDPADLDVVFGPGAYTLARDRTDIELAESESQQRVSLHSPVMLLALAVFLLEQILGNRFYRSRAAEPVSTRSRAAA